LLAERGKLDQVGRSEPAKPLDVLKEQAIDRPGDEGQDGTEQD
jgi:hypothetical protein